MRRDYSATRQRQTAAHRRTRLELKATFAGCALGLAVADAEVVAAVALTMNGVHLDVVAARQPVAIFGAIAGEGEKRRRGAGRLHAGAAHRLTTDIAAAG